MTQKSTQWEVDNLDKSGVHVHMTHHSAEWKPKDDTISYNEFALRASTSNIAEPCPRECMLQAVSAAKDKFSIFNLSLALATTPEPPVSVKAPYTVQISTLQWQNASAEADIDSFAEELEWVSTSISSVQSKEQLVQRP